MSLTAAKKAFEVAKANLAFAKLSKPEQRVVIAKDVISAIRAKWLKPATGNYLYVEDNEGDKITSCEACALGSVFVCASRRGAVNATTEDSFWTEDQNEMHKKLAPYFSEAQLYLIEEAFEVYGYAADDDVVVGNTLHKRAMQFGIKQAAADKRLVSIMENIIKNKGTFKP